MFRRNVKTAFSPKKLHLKLASFAPFNLQKWLQPTLWQYFELQSVIIIPLVSECGDVYTSVMAEITAIMMHLANILLR